jgi:hypothetical protein
MQLFTRTVSLAGPNDEVMSFATGMRELVSDRSGREIALWMVSFGAPIGTFVYSARVEGLADLQQIGATLIADPEYHAKLASGRQLGTAPPTDQLSTPIYGELGAVPPVGSTSIVTTAAISNGKYAEALAWGVEISQYVEGVTGFPTLFLSQDFGDFGRVTWIGVTPDAASADTAGQKINADPGYLGKLAAAGELFAQGSGQRALLTRVA